eukprot:387619-Prorocentrum_minimum.AAC.1
MNNRGYGKPSEPARMRKPRLPRQSSLARASSSLLSQLLQRQSSLGLPRGTSTASTTRANSIQSATFQSALQSAVESLGLPFKPSHVQQDPTPAALPAGEKSQSQSQSQSQSRPPPAGGVLTPFLLTGGGVGLGKKGLVPPLLPPKGLAPVMEVDSPQGGSSGNIERLGSTEAVNSEGAGATSPRLESEHERCEMHDADDLSDDASDLDWSEWSTLSGESSPSAPASPRYLDISRRGSADAAEGAAAAAELRTPAGVDEDGRAEAPPGVDPMRRNSPDADDPTTAVLRRVSQSFNKGKEAEGEGGGLISRRESMMQRAYRSTITAPLNWVRQQLEDKRAVKEDKNAEKGRAEDEEDGAKAAAVPKQPRKVRAETC